MSLRKTNKRLKESLSEDIKDTSRKEVREKLRAPSEGTSKSALLQAPTEKVLTLEEQAAIDKNKEREDAVAQQKADRENRRVERKINRVDTDYEPSVPKEDKVDFGIGDQLMRTPAEDAIEDKKLMYGAFEEAKKDKELSDRLKPEDYFEYMPTSEVVDSIYRSVKAADKYKIAKASKDFLQGRLKAGDATAFDTYEDAIDKLTQDFGDKEDWAAILPNPKSYVDLNTGHINMDNYMKDIAEAYVRTNKAIIKEQHDARLNEMIQRAIKEGVPKVNVYGDVVDASNRVIVRDGDKWTYTNPKDIQDYKDGKIPEPKPTVTAVSSTEDLARAIVNQTMGTYAKNGREPILSEGDIELINKWAELYGLARSGKTGNISYGNTKEGSSKVSAKDFFKHRNDAYKTVTKLRDSRLKALSNAASAKKFGMIGSNKVGANLLLGLYNILWDPSASADTKARAQEKIKELSSTSGIGEAELEEYARAIGNYANDISTVVRGVLSESTNVPEGTNVGRGSLLDWVDANYIPSVPDNYVTEAYNNWKRIMGTQTAPGIIEVSSGGTVSPIFTGNSRALLKLNVLNRVIKEKGANAQPSEIKKAYKEAISRSTPSGKKIYDEEFAGLFDMAESFVPNEARAPKVTGSISPVNQQAVTSQTPSTSVAGAAPQASQLSKVKYTPSTKAVKAPNMKPLNQDAWKGVPQDKLDAWGTLEGTAKDVANTYGNEVIAAAKKYNVNPTLLAALIAVESANNPQAVSNKGAYGLGQVTFDAWGKTLPEDITGFTPGEEVTREKFKQKMFDPATGIMASAYVLANYLNQTGGDVGRALEMYNGGTSATPSSDAQEYAKKVQYLYNKLK